MSGAGICVNVLSLRVLDLLCYFLMNIHTLPNGTPGKDHTNVLSKYVYKIKMHDPDKSMAT